jgi:hypothetical protein
MISTHYDSTQSIPYHTMFLFFFENLSIKIHGTVSSSLNGDVRRYATGSVDVKDAVDMMVGSCCFAVYGVCGCLLRFFCLFIDSFKVLYNFGLFLYNFQ